MDHLDVLVHYDYFYIFSFHCIFILGFNSHIMEFILACKINISKLFFKMF